LLSAILRVAATLSALILADGRVPLASLESTQGGGGWELLAELHDYSGQSQVERVWSLQGPSDETLQV